MKRLNSVGRIKEAEDSVYMPMNDQGQSEGYDSHWRSVSW